MKMNEVKEDFMKNLTVYHVSPHKKPVVVKITDDSDDPQQLKDMQALVGGHIQLVPLPDFFSDKCMRNVDLFCNDDFRSLGLDINFSVGYDVICGDVFFAGVDFSNGETISLTEQQIAVLNHIFA